MVYRFVGKRSFQDETHARAYEAEAQSVSEAIYNALLLAVSSERKKPEAFERTRQCHFTLSALTVKGEKVILTVLGEGRNWAEAVCDAYFRVCKWQGQKSKNVPEIPS